MRPICTSIAGGYKLDVFHDEDGYASNPRDNDNAGTMITWEREYGSPDANDWERRDESGFLAFRMEWLPTTADVCSACGNDGTLAWMEGYHDRLGWKRDNVTAAPLEKDPEYDDVNCTWCGHEWVPGDGMGKGGVCLTLDRGYNGDLRIIEPIEQWTEDDREPDGVIFVTAETVAKEWGAFTEDPETYEGMPILEWVAGYLEGEVSEYSAWAVGNVYGYVLSEEKKVHVTVTDRESGDTLEDEDEDRWDEVDACWGFITADPEKDILAWGIAPGQVGGEENYKALADGMKWVV